MPERALATGGLIAVVLLFLGAGGRSVTRGEDRSASTAVALVT
jgi:hypothetical protein